MYDGVLRLPLPREAQVVGFADDIAVVVVAKHREEIVEICNRTIRQIQQWLASTGLELAEHKTEAVLITSRKALESITLEVGAQTILTQPAIRYLGIMIDSRLSYKTHLITSSERASRVNAALSRLMPNTRGARQGKRVLLASVVTSTLMYGAPIWADAVQQKTYRRRLETVHRLSALRVVCAFRTVSDDAACVLAGMPPIDILAKERQATYLRRGHGTKKEIRRTARGETMATWQKRWDDSIKGRWTYRLIPSIDTWLNRQHGEVDYNLTQFLTGHGCFKAYLFKYKHEESPDCPLCIGTLETAEHVLFECPRFNEERKGCEALGHQLTPENVIDFMLETEDGWNAVSGTISRMAKELRCLERGRNAMRN